MTKLATIGSLTASFVKASSKANISSDGSIETETNTTTKNETTEIISVVLKINGKEYLAELSIGKTVFDLMKRLQDETDFQFTGTDYDYLGFFVESINGIYNNSSTGEYWIYYVNDEKAKMGISSRLIKNNDVIEWKYEKEEL